MANFVLILCLCICAVGTVCCQNSLTTSTVPVLTITHDKDKVQFICTLPAGTTAMAGTDKVAFTKDSASAVFKTSTDTDYAVGAQSSTWDVVTASFTTSNYGSYTCQLQLTTGSVISTSSLAVALPACSSAPRIVDSLTLAVVCLLATVVKAKY